jgi:hypothetical protein
MAAGNNGSRGKRARQKWGRRARVTGKGHCNGRQWGRLWRATATSKSNSEGKNNGRQRGWKQWAKVKARATGEDDGQGQRVRGGSNDGSRGLLKAVVINYNFRQTDDCLCILKW